MLLFFENLTNTYDQKLLNLNNNRGSFELIVKGELKACALCNRVRPRFFDQVGHETMYASSGN